MSGELVRALGEDEQQQDSEDFDFVDYCARPMCRKEFRRNAGRGRRRDYCSETCRRLADRDYKRAKAMVDQFERLARRSRHDVLAFGRASEQDGGQPSEEIALERALRALGRAESVLRFASDADERLLTEIRTLCDDVRPLVEQARAS